MHITILCGDRVAVARNIVAPGRDQSRKSPFSEDVFVSSIARMRRTAHIAITWCTVLRCNIAHTLFCLVRDCLFPSTGTWYAPTGVVDVHVRCALQNLVGQHFVCWGSIRAEARLREMHSGQGPRSGRMMRCDLHNQSSISPLSTGKDVPKHVGLSCIDHIVVSGCTVA